MRYKRYSNGPNFFFLGLLFILLFGGFRVLLLLFGALLAIFIQLFPLFLFGMIGYFILRSVRRNNQINDGVNPSIHHRRFVELLVHVLVHVIKVEDPTDRRGIAIIEGFFSQNLSYDRTKMMWVHDLIGHSLKTDYSLSELCLEFKQTFSSQSRLILLELVYRVVFSDHRMSKKEEAMIETIVSTLGIRTHEHIRIRSFFVSEDKTDKYRKILGVEKAATVGQIKTAYRDACKKYHPDKVHHLGEEFQDVAKEQMQKINEAYQFLAK